MAKILAVEDEPLVLLLVSETLQDAGHTLLEAENGEVALELLRTTPDIDLVVTDVRMPKLDGFGLAAAARTLRPEVSMLFMTGYAGSEVPKDLSRTPVLVKPFAPDVLVTTVEKILGA